MKLEIKIGLVSNGEDFKIDLVNEPNLFISYTDEIQLYQSFKYILFQLQTNNNSKQISFAYALSEKFVDKIFTNIPKDFYYARFIRNEYRNAHIESRKQFWSMLLIEFKRRFRLFKLSKNSNNSAKPKIIIFIDDIFDMVLNQSKKSGISFLEIAVYGEHVGMHFITASSGTYRNLLHQLIQLHPLIEKKILKNKTNSFIKIANPLGSELILSGEGLLFYKEKSNPDMKRIFPFVDL